MIDADGQLAGEGRRFRQLRTLTEVSRALTSTLSTAEIYRIVMPHAAELLGSERAVLLLPDERGQYMVRATHGVEEALFERAYRPTEDSVEELLERVLEAPQGEILAVPLVARDRVSGVLAVRLERTLADEDGWALAALADQAAVALDQAGLATPRQNEELLGLLVDFLADHVIVALDSEGRVETWNHGAERALGYRAWEVLGRSIGQFYAEPGERPAAALRAAVAAGRHEEEVIWAREDGQQFLANVLMVAFKEPDGRLRGFAVLARDITERRRVEQAQRDIIREQAARAEAEAQRDRYRLLGRATKDAIRDWNIDTGAVEWNEALQTSYGHALAGVAPTLDWWTVHVHPEDRARVTAKLRATLAGSDESWSDEYAFVRSDGSRARVYDRGYVLRDEAGRPTRMISSMLDLSERVRMEGALRDREERLRLAAAAAEVGTWRIDLAPPTASMDSGERDLSLETSTLTQFLAHVHADDRVKVQARLSVCLERGDPYSSVHRVLRADGDKINVRWIRDRGQVFRGPDGAPAYITGAAADITELKEIDEQRQQLMVVAEEARARSELERSRAETANRMKDEFLATVSHELRTPLTAILGWVRILRDSQFDRARVEKGMEIIERNARAQVRIVEDILDVSRIITGKVQLDLRRLNVAAMLEAAMSTVSAAASAKGVTMSWTAAASPGELLGDAERLQQVLWNLLANAIKFTPQGGEIALSAGREAGQLVITVRDTGKGIAAGFLPYVFERFLQDEPTSTRAYGGLGLGLAIVRHIVDLHGGTVEAHSPGEGLGATFIVRLPVTAAAAQADPEVSPVDGPHDPRALHDTELLVVDDEQDTRELVATILESAGARVVTATSAAEAMDLLRLHAPDAIVSDIGMPGEDGYSLIARIRACGDEQLRFVPALALTAYARAEDRRRAHAAGFQMFMAKPIDPQELVQGVVELLEGRMS